MDALIAELREALARYDGPDSALIDGAATVISCARDVVAAYKEN